MLIIIVKIYGYNIYSQDTVIFFISVVLLVIWKQFYKMVSLKNIIITAC